MTLFYQNLRFIKKIRFHCMSMLHDDFIVLGSDGIFDVTNPEEIRLMIIETCIEHNKQSNKANIFTSLVDEKYKSKFHASKVKDNENMISKQSIFNISGRMNENTEEIYKKITQNNELTITEADKNDKQIKNHISDNTAFLNSDNKINQENASNILKDNHDILSRKAAVVKHLTRHKGRTASSGNLSRPLDSAKKIELFSNRHSIRDTLQKQSMKKIFGQKKDLIQIDQNSPNIISSPTKSILDLPQKCLKNTNGLFPPQITNKPELLKDIFKRTISKCPPKSKLCAAENLPFNFMPEKIAEDVLAKIKKKNIEHLSSCDNLSLIIIFLHRGLKRS